jgi:acetyl esterase/lipase
MPADVRILRDVPYIASASASQTLDVYWRPDGEPRALLLWIHGGGWMTGDKANCDAARSALVDGYALASINYRLSDEATFPAQLHDCRAAVRWMRRNAAAYNVDADRIGAWGSSAGGHLAALLGTASGSLREGDSSSDAVSDGVQAVCDWFGPTDFLRMNDEPGAMDHDAADSPESRLVGGPIRECLDRVSAANPATYVTAASPPFLLVHGADDRLVLPSQSAMLHDALTEAGVTSELVVIAGADHGFGAEHIDAVMSSTRAFFRCHLRPVLACHRFPR